MWYWIQKIFVGTKECNHSWHILKTIDVWDNPNSKYPIYEKYVLQCVMCGDIKVKKTN